MGAPPAATTLLLAAAAGLAAGAVLAAMAVFVAGQYVEQMADLYADRLMLEHDLLEEEFDEIYRSILPQQAALAMVGGLAAGALVGVAHLRVGRRKAGSAFKVALAVAGAAWFSLYVMPALKYPHNPDTLFIPGAAGQYAMMFAAYAASSGLAALGSAAAFARTGRKNWYVGAAGAYLAAAAALFFAFPGLPEPDAIPVSLLGAWRSATAAAVTAFWFTLGIVAGALLERAEGQGRKSKGARRREEA